MAVVRLIIALVVSVGLVVAGATQASAMRVPATTMGDTTMDDTTGEMSAPNHEHHGSCPCCNGAGQCTMANCPMHCVPFGQGAEAWLGGPILGHASTVGVVPRIHTGLNPKPPIPPPRD